MGGTNMGVIWNNQYMKALRKAMKYSQADFASKVGLSTRQYGKYERGDLLLSDELKDRLDEVSKELPEDRIKFIFYKFEDGAIAYDINGNPIKRYQEILDGAISAQKPFAYKCKEIRGENSLFEFQENHVTMIRKGQEFNPCTEPRLDMINLLKDLNTEEHIELEKIFQDLGELEEKQKGITDVTTLKTVVTSTLRDEDSMRGNFSGFRRFYSIGGDDVVIRIGYQQAKGSSTTHNGVTQFGELVYDNKVSVMFNPNKLKMETNQWFKRLVKVLGLDVTVKSFDVCKDGNYHWNQLINVEGMYKEDGSPKYGFWDMGKGDSMSTKYIKKIKLDGRLNTKEKFIKIYDKRAEIKEMDKKDIGYNLVRYEFTTTNDKPIPIVAISKSYFPKRGLLPVVNFIDCKILNPKKATLNTLDEMFMYDQVKRIIEGSPSKDMSILSPELRKMFTEVLNSLKTGHLTITQGDMRIASTHFMYRYIDFYENNFGLTSEDRRYIQETRNKFGLSEELMEQGHQFKLIK